MNRRPLFLALARHKYTIYSTVVILMLSILFAFFLNFAPPIILRGTDNSLAFTLILCSLLFFVLLTTRLTSFLDNTLRPERLAYKNVAPKINSTAQYAPDLARFFESVIQALCQTLNSRNASIWLHQPEDGALRLCQIGGNPATSEMDELPLDLNVGSLSGTHPVTTLPESAFRYGWTTLGAEYFSCLIWHGDLIGMIGLGPQRLHVPYSEDAIQFLNWMANQVTLVVKVAQLAEELEETLNHLQVAYRQTIEVQEEERRSLAAELHDDILGRLTTMSLTLRKSQRNVTVHPDQVRDWLEVLEQETQTVNRRLREITQGLHPSVLTDLGIVSALQAYIDLLSRQPLPPSSPRAITLTAQGFGADRIPNPKLERDAYHIARQALDNAVAHAQADQVFIHLRWSEDAISITVQDTGRGMNADPESLMGHNGRLGLLSMHERGRAWGGRLTVDTEKDRGTTVRASLPIDQPSKSPTHLVAFTQHLKSATQA